MGVGTPSDLLDGIYYGIDMFDCVLPTRMARNGALYTSQGRINISNACWTEEEGPIDPKCDCKVCRLHSAAYLRHLHQSKEILYSRLATYHNLAYYAKVMEGARAAIEQDTFPEYRRACYAAWDLALPPDA
jgi:queuine tRNA-ribosyltransferase